MSWKAQVVCDSSNEWRGNALRFETRKEAEEQVRDLSWRWLAVRKTRVVECDDAVNYSYVDGKLIEVERQVQS